jgi:hypothetical protein
MVDLEDYSVRAETLLSGFRQQGMAPPQIGDGVRSFTDNLINDVRKIWVNTGTRITIQAPGRGPGFTQAQSNQGTPVPIWNAAVLVTVLYGELRTWNHWWNKVFGKEPEQVDVIEPVLF